MVFILNSSSEHDEHVQKKPDFFPKKIDTDVDVYKYIKEVKLTVSVHKCALSCELPLIEEQWLGRR